MHTRFFSILFLFTLLIAVFAAPVPEPESEAQVEDESGELDARGLERRTSGRATYYDPGLGACGKTNKGSELVVALSSNKFKGSCGKYITVKYGKNSVRCKVVDLCPGCPNNAIDMSRPAFKKLAPLAKGVLQVNWSFS
ncbi:rare lipoprotein A-like double-psi beta-barrel protein [Ceratobasidium sp. AG-Ba]|nr:rare lipoprotein A-like double-psi beta-barrel protein [Ceratobasidium sp. AG-Ba]